MEKKSLLTFIFAIFLFATGEILATSVSFEADFDKTGFTSLNPSGTISITSNIDLNLGLSYFKDMTNNKPWGKNLTAGMDFYLANDWSMSFGAEYQPPLDNYSRIDGKGSVKKTFGDTFTFTPSVLVDIIQNMNTVLLNAITKKPTRIVITENDYNPVLEFGFNDNTSVTISATLSAYFIFDQGKKLTLQEFQQEFPRVTLAVFRDPATHTTTGNFKTQSYNILFSQKLFTIITLDLSYTRNIYLLKSPLYDDTYEPSVTVDITEKLAIVASVIDVSPNTGPNTITYVLSASYSF